jgi:hypothetical protein
VAASGKVKVELRVEEAKAVTEKGKAFPELS